MPCFAGIALAIGGLSAAQVESGAMQIMVSIDPGDAKTLAWLEDCGWCDILDVHPHATEGQLAALRRRGWQVALQMMAHPESFKRRRYSGNGQDPLSVDAVIQRHIRAAGGRPEAVTWQFLVEEDSAGVAFPYQLLKEKPQTHAAAYALFKKRIDEALEATRPYPGVRLWARAGFAPSLHPFAASGAETILIERTNDDVEDLQTGIAFARGAAHQYGCGWGVDFSQWWGPVYGLDVDHSAAYFRRNFYVSFFSGADLAAIEYVQPDAEPAREGSDSLAAALDEFAVFAKGVARGRPEVPVAVLLPRDHGWMTPPYWQIQPQAWNYARIPYRPGDQSIDGVFGAAFPGSTFAMQPFPFGAYASDDPPASPFALSCVTREYAPSEDDIYKAPPPIPFGRFHSRNEARETMARDCVDSAPYRPMADSRWGDIIDVLTEDAALEVMGRYKVCVLAGSLTLTKALAARLVAFVEQGGVLIWAAGTARPEHKDLIGLRIVPELRVGRAWAWQDEDPVREPFLYLPGEVLEPGAVTVLAKTPGGAPVATRTRLGSGSIVTCLLPW